MRIDGHQRHLRHGAGLDPGFGLRILARADFDFVGPPFFHLLVHQLHARVHRLGGGALEVRVERGVHAIGMIVQLAFAELVGELVLHQVHEVRGVAGFHVGGRHFERVRLGAVSLLASDGAGFNHGVEHQVAAFQGALGTLVRR